ncbi:MAG: hypothetical protein HYS38_01620 [Acidobacteria bacterium]|nr:hypothetical protein [Acidobacteriota bacterium]
MTLEAVKKAIEHLPKKEQRALVHWLDEREQAAWDAEIEKDFSSGGRGMPLLEKVKADVRAGKFKPMEEGRGVRRK